MQLLFVDGAALNAAGFEDHFEILRSYHITKTVDQPIRPYAEYLGQFGLFNMLVSGLPRADSQQWQRRILGNHWQKSWYDRYVAKGHYRFDPCVRRCRVTDEPFMWSEIPAGELGARQRLVLNEAADFGMRDGLCVPIHPPIGPPAVITLSGERVELGRDDQHIVEMLSRELLRGIDRLTKRSAQPSLTMTTRETEVAQLTADGDTAVAASQKLFISHHTVERHLLNIRTKLGCSNTTEAIAKALRLHLIY